MLAPAYTLSPSTSLPLIHQPQRSTCDPPAHFPATNDREHDLGYLLSSRKLGVSEDAEQSLAACIGSFEPLHCNLNVTCPQYTQGWEIASRLLNRKGDFTQAFKMVDAFEEEEHMVYSVVFSELLQQSIREKNLSAGRRVHSLIIGSGCEADYMLASSLVHMFAVCGSLAEAIQIFHRMQKRNVYAWTALMDGYTESGQYSQAIEAYYEMEQLNLETDGHVFVAVLRACSGLKSLEDGRHIHACIMESGLDSNVYVSSALINMYAKCGTLDNAYVVFEKLSKGNVVSWSALIQGCVEHSHGKAALQLFRHMEEECVEPNEVTYISMLKACSSITALEQGKHMHAQIIQKGLESNLSIGNALIDMYSKCGSICDAHTMFHRMFNVDVISWSSLIGGYAKHNNYHSALGAFLCMQEMNIEPNGITYLSVLSACSHAVLFAEGCYHFKCMAETHSIWPTLEHYNALVDIIGRSGRLDAAEDLIETLPFGGPNYAGWTSLLDSCRLHGEVSRGKECFDRIVSIEDRDALGYVLMSSIYAKVGLWDDFRKIEDLRKCANLVKKPAKAYIEVDSSIHEFIVDDNSHPQIHEVYMKLSSLDLRMRELGYIPQQRLDSFPVKEVAAFCGHSEKLAIAFGLISTPEGTTVRVAKNLRVCTDCHNSVKLISKIERREIIIADAYQIHHFREGDCCCKDEYA
ncbi:hypothetical protein KP509_18G069700 [Ceratopteris richardii]|uniref:DYW domain-containing protein n=1 Tax=Ceratopteris richardii TaxID=49495 RepID=A0A8T2SVA1_CERRI|nr:hypothetical protein KP509_18G069700 [Ceratopteris richardii]